LNDRSFGFAELEGISPPFSCSVPFPSPPFDPSSLPFRRPRTPAYAIEFSCSDQITSFLIEFSLSPPGAPFPDRLIQTHGLMSFWRRGPQVLFFFLFSFFARFFPPLTGPFLRISDGPSSRILVFLGLNSFPTHFMGVQISLPVPLASRDRPSRCSDKESRNLVIFFSSAKPKLCGSCLFPGDGPPLREDVKICAPLFWSPVNF